MLEARMTREGFEATERYYQKLLEAIIDNKIIGKRVRSVRKGKSNIFIFHVSDEVLRVYNQNNGQLHALLKPDYRNQPTKIIIDHNREINRVA